MAGALPVAVPPAVRAATAHDAAAREAFWIGGERVGSVAKVHLPALAAYPQSLRIAADGVWLTVPEAERDAALDRIARDLHGSGLILGWRDEIYAVCVAPTQPPLARIERAASRFWGTLTFGTHANGYVAAADGRPTHLWVAQRSLTKPTDPGLFDNLIGGGVPHGQTPLAALVREGWEEAGLSPAQMADARPGSVIRLLRDIPEGLQHEWLYAYDLPLPRGLTPQNRDGEVANFRLLPVAEAISLAEGETMTVDAALVTLDFALRHSLLPAARQAEIAAAMAGIALPVGPGVAGTAPAEPRD